VSQRWFRYFVVFRGLSWLPERAAYRLANCVGDFDRRRQSGHAEAVAAGLRLAFPTQSDALIADLVQANFRMLAREVLDVFYLSRRSASDLGKVFFPSGFEVLERAGQERRGTIIAMAHYGRPIMLSTALGLAGFRVGMLSQAVDERNPDLDAVEQSYLQFKMRHTVAQAGGPWITTRDNLRSLYEALAQGEILIIMLDVAEPDPAKCFEAPFLGGTLAVPNGILRIAQKTGARLVYGVARDRDRAVAAELRPLPEAPDAALTAAIRHLEGDVLAAPWQWWQWYHLKHVWRPGA
jgi:KDO2-lipid IV(A) lauroyltransferase